MKYYVVSDIHGFCSILKETLTEKGFFNDSEPHKLIICGDLFDRGKEARDLQEFVLERMRKDEVILIRGNHEDLMLKMLEDMEYGRPVLYSYHTSNGTVDTAKQLIRENTRWYDSMPEPVIKQMQNTPYLTRIIPSMIDYFETKHYIFVHGWIPCFMLRLFPDQQKYSPMTNWRTASPEEWEEARWTNGMEAAHEGVLEQGKTIVCGHWHTSFGHSVYEKKGEAFGADADFSPYYAEGIIAIDACTAYSGKINCLVIEDEPI